MSKNTIIKYILPITIWLVALITILWLGMLTTAIKKHRAKEHRPVITNSIADPFMLTRAIYCSQCHTE